MGICLHMELITRRVESLGFPHNLMDMGCLLGTVLKTILNYKRVPYVHP